MDVHTFICMIEDKGEIDMGKKMKTADFQRISDFADKLTIAKDSEIGSKLIKDL